MNFNYVLGGLAQGLGTGMTKSAENLRMARLEDLRAQRAANEAQKDRDFRSGESRLDRDFRADEADKSRKHDMNKMEREILAQFDRDEAQFGRDKALKLMDQGFSREMKNVDRETMRDMENLRGSIQRQLAGDERDFKSAQEEKAAGRISQTVTNSDNELVGVTPSGKAWGLGVKMAPGGAKGGVKPTADIQNTEYLAEIMARKAGRDKASDEDKLAAYKTINQAMSDPNAAARAQSAIFNSILSDYSNKLSTDEAWSKAGEMVRSASGGAPAGAAPGAQPNGEIPLAPQNPADRKVGQIYRTADGRKVQYMQDGRWMLVQ